MNDITRPILTASTALSTAVPTDEPSLGTCAQGAKTKRPRGTKPEESLEEMVAVGRRLGALFALPFVAASESGPTTYWAPRPQGDYVVDCDIGAAYGRQLVSYVREFGDMQVLRQLAFSLMKWGDAERDRGLLVGMFGVIGDAILSGRAGPGRT